jgi:signal transduction histidine kinase
VQAEPRVEPLPGARRLSVAGVGVTLVLGAALVFLWANGALDAAGDAVLATVVVVVALGLILAPVWWRLGRNLAAERAERIRSQERAELGAHLHDSVLQTLALMQRRADDPREVAALARRQERELRAWLLDRPQARAGESLAAALEAAAAQVEETHGGGIEVVTVGDCALDDRAEAVLAAAREAILNAAKFAGDAGPIDVFAEVTPRRIEVFVRDRGPGFDPASLPDDRHGVRESIVGRMERHGGRTEIRTGADGGTEVELSLERGAP